MPSQKTPGRPGGDVSRFQRPGSETSQRNTQVRRMPPPRNAYEREEKKVFPYWTIPVVFVCVGLLSLISWWVAQEYQVYQQFQEVSRQVAVDTFYPGIRVNGTDIGGMTMGEAQATLESHTNQQSEAFAIGITYGRQKMADHVRRGSYPLRYAGSARQSLCAGKARKPETALQRRSDAENRRSVL